MKVKLSRIKVNLNHEEVFTTREIDGMVESMGMNEMKRPVVVSEDLFIISGYRQYLVAKFLGWEEIEVMVRRSDRQFAEFTDISSGMSQRKKSTDVLNEIQQLYQNYTRLVGQTQDPSESDEKTGRTGTTHQMESWYW